MINAAICLSDSSSNIACEMFKIVYNYKQSLFPRKRCFFYIKQTLSYLIALFIKVHLYRHYRWRGEGVAQNYIGLKDRNKLHENESEKDKRREHEIEF